MRPIPWCAGMRGTVAGTNKHGVPITRAPVVVERQTGLFWFWPDTDCFGARVGEHEHPAYVLDRHHSATLGALLGVLRELYNDPCAHLSFDGERWHVLARIDLQADPVFDGVGSGDDEFDALQAAREAHPSPTLTPSVGSP